MTKEQAKRVLELLEGFARLERKACDEAGWIMLKLSVSRAKAERMIAQAREAKP